MAHPPNTFLQGVEDREELVAHRLLAPGAAEGDVPVEGAARAPRPTGERRAQDGVHGLGLRSHWAAGWSYEGPSVSPAASCPAQVGSSPAGAGLVAPEALNRMAVALNSAVPDFLLSRRQW